MASLFESQIASVLSVLTQSTEDSANCPLGVFARDLRSLLQTQGRDGTGLADALAEHSVELVKEEEKINATREMITLTYDKLRAEVTRVEAQMREQERRLKEVSQQKKLCKVALNLVVSGDVPHFTNLEGAAGAGEYQETSDLAAAARAAGDKDEEAELQPSRVAPEPAPLKNSPSPRPSKDTPPSGAPPTASNPPAPAAKRTGGATSPGPAGTLSSPRASSGVSSTGLLAMLRLPDVKEGALLSSIESYERQHFPKDNSWMSTEAYPDVLSVLLALMKHLPEPRPPVQLAELRVLGYVLQAPPTPDTTYNKNLLTMLDALLKKGDAIPTLTKLLNSVNDDVKCEVLECLSPLVCISHALVATPATSAPATALLAFARREFLMCGGLEPLVNIVVCSTSEGVLERALVFLWGLLSKDEKVDAESNGGKPLRSNVRELGGLRAVLDLLYTDSLAILENVCMVIGYITRDDSSKRELRDIGGLEKITATLRHPSDSIKTKMAGAVWNCASNPENRTYLRQLGAIPALLELLRPQVIVDIAAYEFVRENAAGALWNLSVDAENKTQILDYGGIPVLIQVMSSSNSVAVVENVSGTLWNCSAAAEARPVIRKAGGITVLLSLLNDRKTPAGSSSRASSSPTTAPFNEKIIDNVAGTLRNCAINDQNKPVIREAGGVEIILQKIKDSVLTQKGRTTNGPALSPSIIDKLASALWILTISPEIKHTVRMAGGIEVLTKILEQASPIIAGSAKGTGKNTSLFPPHRPPPAGNHLVTSDNYYQAFYAPPVLQKIPSATPVINATMNIKEKLVGVLRNCSTVAENRSLLISCGAVRCLVATVLDCYASQTAFPGSGSVMHKNCSRPLEPSLQLKETVSSALWYLSRDDKVTPGEQGGLELMCMFLVMPQQPTAVLEQAAGALSSLAASNSENRESIRQNGGLQALVRLITEKAAAEFPVRKGDAARTAKVDGTSHSYVVLNALLTIRNSTTANEDNLRYCTETATAGKGEFLLALLHLIANSSEECAKEAASIVKNLCGSGKVVELVMKNNGVAVLNGLSERATTDSTRRAAATVLQSLNRPQRRAT